MQNMGNFCLFSRTLIIFAGFRGLPQQADLRAVNRNGQPLCEQDLIWEVPVPRGSNPGFLSQNLQMGSGVKYLLALQSFSKVKHLLRSPSALFTH